MKHFDRGASATSRVDKRVVLIVAAMVGFLTPFMGSSVNIALPSIAKEFSVNAVTMSWVSTAYLVAAAMFLIPLGKFADIYGRKKVLLSGLVGYTVVSLLCALSISETMLVSFRALQGFTDAMMFGTSTAILASVYPPKERGRALGIAVASVYIGLATGPFIGGSLTQMFGWRSIFVLTAILGVCTVSMTLWKIRGEWAEASGQKMDVIGSAVYAVTLLALMYGFTLLPAAPGIGLIAISLLLMGVFAFWESKAPFPVLDVNLFRHNIVFALSNLSALINYCATFAIGFMLSLYLQYIKGLDPWTAGLVMLAQPVVMAVFSPLAGRLSDRIEPRIVASIGMTLSTVGLVLITFLDGTSTMPHIVGVLLFCGLGFALFSSPNTNAIMSSVDRSRYGVASATVGAMRLIGQMLSMGIATLVIALFVGNVQITPQYYPAFLDSFKISFSIFAALCFAGIFASLARGTVRQSSPSNLQKGE